MVEQHRVLGVDALQRQAARRRRATTVSAGARGAWAVRALAGGAQVDAPALAGELRRRADTARAIVIAAARLAGLAAAVARAEAVRTGGQAQLVVEDRALCGVTPGARPRFGIAQPRANLFAALVFGANLVRDTQAIGVGFARRAKLALPAHAALDALRATMKRLVLTDLIERHAARITGLAFQCGFAVDQARVGARRAHDDAAVIASGAVVVRRAVDRAVRIQITGTCADAQRLVGAFVAVRAGRVELAGLGWSRVTRTEVLAPAVDVVRLAMTDRDAVGVRPALVAAFAFYAAEAMVLIAVVAGLAGGEAPAGRPAVGAGAVGVAGRAGAAGRAWRALGVR